MEPMTITLRSLLPVLLGSVLLAQGRIVVAHDEWTLSPQGFINAPTAGQFVQNIAAWFHGGQPGHFHAWSYDANIANPQVAAAMAAAGHTWTVGTAGAPTLATLQQYDGVFLVDLVPNLDVLAQYVENGGNVYVAAGTGLVTAAQWNPFLEQFGLSLGALNGFQNVWPIASPHPLFAGVASLYHWNGNSVSLTASAGPGAQVLVTEGGQGLYAVYDGMVGSMAKNTALGAGCSGLSLAATSRPLLGQSWNLSCSGIDPTALFGIEVFGASDPGIDDLAVIGMPNCGLRASLDVLVAFAVAGGTHGYALPIPSSVGLIGVDLFSTTVVFPSQPVNPFGAITANGLRGRLGNV